MKREHIETLENALGNPQLNQDYWKSLLDKEGSDRAFRGNLYGDRFVRLLTLKAMLVPRFLPVFLAWLANSKEWGKTLWYFVKITGINVTRNSEIYRGFSQTF